MKLSHFTAAALAVALSSCADPKAPSEANFAAAFEQHLEEMPPHERRLCYHLRDYDAARKAVVDESIRMDSPATRARQALVDAGILEAPSFAEKKGPFGRTQTEATYLVRPGKESEIVETEHPTLFGGTVRQYQVCGGQLELVDVVRWTEPAAGQNQAVVTYKLRYVDIPAWVTNEDLMSWLGAPKHTSGEPYEVQWPMTLTNEGWRL